MSRRNAASTPANRGRCLTQRVDWVGRSVWGVVAIGLLSVCKFGCVKEREYEGHLPCVSWNDDIKELMARDCVSCHSTENPSGGYALDGYLAALGTGSDAVPNAVAFDSTSKLLTVLSPDRADTNHSAVVADRTLLTEWVVSCGLSYRASLIHEGGIMNPEDPGFHGTLIKDSGYDFEQCQRCHGADYAGGTSEASCLTCHANGPKDCETCHPRASVLAQGAHRAHVEPGALDKTTLCQDCHLVPSKFDDPGHVFLADGTLDPPPAEVIMTGLATGTATGSSSGSSSAGTTTPHYDASTNTCSGVYCHGASFSDTAAGKTEPTWQAGLGQAACGKCHGLPPSNHAIGRCEICHQQTVGPGGSLRDLARHLDGVVQVGIEGEGCSGCHGSAASPAPPPGLFGTTNTSTTPVGAHQIHLLPKQHLRGAMACEDCHLVPTDILDSGHIDSPLPAEVFPSEIAASSLAFAGDAQPTWNHETRKCSDVYCHGGGVKLSLDTSPDVNRTPEWTSVGRQEVVCGSCHGLPPTVWPHYPTLTIHDCVLCHATAVDEFGNILFQGPSDSPTSVHINGQIDP